ncbi:MAG: radical SAM protein [Clostridia bacterium]|nr:radical SAM protein [Clostridia bacterium]
MKKQICFVQANNVYGETEKTTYIPYSAGCIEAYCLTRPLIKNECGFTKIVYSRMAFEELDELLSEPFMVLFSCSVWNFEYNKYTAARIKEKYPGCYIVFGGHSVAAQGEDLSACPYVDFITHRFGEEPTADLIECLLTGGELKDVPNISFRSGNDVVTTQEVPQTGCDYPSPYLTGIFDDLLADGVRFSALFETNRGCPNRCAFCDWGSLKSKVRLFPMERVKAEIDWFAEHKVEYVLCTDANFCLFSRDEEIADYIVESKKTKGYPRSFRVCFTKNKFDSVLRIGKKLADNGLDRAQTVSFQSTDPQTLENIGRRNISLDFFRNLMIRYNDLHINTHTELIIGLPGETYESFCCGVCSLIENGQHFSINIYCCELLPNSLMGQKDYKEKYGIKSVRLPFRLIHSDASQHEGEITEYSECVVATYSMSTDDWVNTMMFGIIIQVLHNLGLLRCLAVFFRYEKGLSYLDFYNRILDSAKKKAGSVLNDAYTRIIKLVRGVPLGKNGMVTLFDDIPGVLWGFDELFYLNLYKELDRFYEEIFDALGISPEDDVLSELVAYQKAVVKKIGEPAPEITSGYDFYGYFNGIFLNTPTPLRKIKNTITIKDDSPVYTMGDFAREVLWYGRNRRATDYTATHYPVEQHFFEK